MRISLAKRVNRCWLKKGRSNFKGFYRTDWGTQLELYGVNEKMENYWSMNLIDKRIENLYNLRNEYRHGIHENSFCLSSKCVRLGSVCAFVLIKCWGKYKSRHDPACEEIPPRTWWRTTHGSWLWVITTVIYMGFLERVTPLKKLGWTKPRAHDAPG